MSLSLPTRCILEASAGATQFSAALTLICSGVTTNLQKDVPLEEFVAMGLKNDKGEWTVPSKTLQAGAATYVSLLSVSFAHSLTYSRDVSHLVAAFDPSILSTLGAYLDDGDVKESERVPHALSTVRVGSRTCLGSYWPYRMFFHRRTARSCGS